MSDILVKSIRGFILFFRATLGIINSPYVTYRRLSGNRKELSGTVYIYLLCVLYFIWVTAVKTDSHNPYLITMQFPILLFWAISGVGFLLSVLYFMAKIEKKQGSFSTLFLLYSYSLVPTVIWFFSTSLLYLFFPPPRFASVLGKSFSILYIAFSIGLLIWKTILYYLTLRFTFRMTAGPFVRVSFVFLSTVILYTISMYKLGIFRIPFI